MDKTTATPSGKSVVSGVENHFIIKGEYLDRYCSLCHSRNSSATDSVADKIFSQVKPEFPLSSVLWVQLEVEILK